MRKLSFISVISVLSIFFALAFTGAALADDWGYEIDPKDAFDKSKMVRTFTIQGKAPEDATEEYPLIWSTVDGHEFQAKTFTGSREFEDLAIVTMHGNKFKVAWFSEDGLNENDWKNLTEWPVGWSGERIEEELVKSIESKKRLFIYKATPASMWYYPRADVISINGEPWQHTVYADSIIERIGNIVKPGEPLGDRNSEAWAMFMDPRTNGAAMIWYKDKDRYARSVIEPEKTYVDLISKYNPLNNGKPYDFSQWQWGDEPDENESELPAEVINGDDQTEICVNCEEPEAKEAREPIENTEGTTPDQSQKVELTLGNNQVSISDGETKKLNTLEVAPKAKDGRTFIPLRGVLDQLGCTLHYDSQGQMVEIKKAEQTILLSLGSTSASVNGKNVELEQPAVIENGRTLIPLRFVSENLGFKVEYDNGKITLTK